MSSGQSWGAADERLSEGREPADRADEPVVRRGRARWRDLSGPALRAESAPPTGDLGDEDFWSYLRGNQVGVDPAERDHETVAEPRACEPASEEVRGPEPAPAPPFWATTSTAQLSTGMFWPEPTTAAPVTDTAAPVTDTAAPVTNPDPDQPTTADPDADQQPVWEAETDAETPDADTVADPAPAWQDLVRPNRRKREPGGSLRRVVPAVLVALGWLAVVAYGALRFDLPWSLGALAAGVAAIAFGLRGRSVIGLAPVLVGAAAWGMVTGGQAPASLADLPGDALLIGWNALYAVPLLVAYALATRVETPERAA